MGNLTIYKQGKDGLFYPAIYGLKPKFESTSSLNSRFQPIYPGVSDHSALRLPQRTVSQTDTENAGLDIVAQLTQLITAQRAYEMEVRKLQESI